MKDTDSAKFSGIYILQCLCEGIPKEQFKPNLTNFLVFFYSIIIIFIINRLLYSIS